MRAAPAVHLRLEGRWPIVGCGALLHVLVASVVVAWGAETLRVAHGLVAGWATGAACVAVICAVGWAGGFWSARVAVSPEPSVLRWSGQAWLLGLAGAGPVAPATPQWGDWPAATPVAVRLALDGGHWVLLRLSRPGQRAGWAVAQQGRSPAVWRAARTALLAHARSQGASAPMTAA